MFVPKDKKDEIFKKMEREAKLVNFGVITLLVLGSISGFVILLPSEKDEEMYFIYELIKDFVLHSWKTQLSLIFSVRELTVNCIWKIHALFESWGCNCEQHQEEIKDTLKFVILRQNDINA